MGRSRSLLIPGVDKKLLVNDAASLMPYQSHRRFIASGTSLGALTLLTAATSPTVLGGEHAEKRRQSLVKDTPLR